MRESLVLSKRWSYIGLVDSSFGSKEMATISSTSIGAQSATQAGWQQLRLQQARQNAQRAEQAAQALAAKAADAQRVADRADENARFLYTQSDQARSEAGQARLGLAMVKSAGEMQSSLANTVEQVSVRQQATNTDNTVEKVPATPIAPAAPVVNTSGQVTGVMINTTA